MFLGKNGKTNKKKNLIVKNWKNREEKNSVRSSLRFCEPRAEFKIENSSVALGGDVTFELGQ